MTMDERKTERDPKARFPEPQPARKPYEAPRLQEWGSIFELTGGDFAGDITDVEGGGSQPV